MNGGLQVCRHAQRQRVHRHGQRAGGVYLVKQGSCAGVQGASSYKINSRFRDRHQAAQHQARQAGDFCGQRQRIAGRDARLVRAAVNIDLQAHLQRRQFGRALLAQALGDFQAVHRLRPVKMLSHPPRLVALDGADAVPFQRRRNGTGAHGFIGLPAAQGVDFFDALGNVVLAKSTLPGLHGFDHRVGAEGFGNCQQAHA